MLHISALSSIFFTETLSLLANISTYSALWRLPNRNPSAYFPLQSRRNLLYALPAVSSSKLLHQLDQLDQVLVAKEASTAGHRHKRIFCHYRGPARWN